MGIVERTTLSYFPVSYFGGLGALLDDSGSADPSTSGPYFPPSYFGAAGFFGGSSAQIPTTSGPYFPPSYFGAAGFFGGSPAQIPTTTGPYFPPSYFGAAGFFAQAVDVVVPVVDVQLTDSLCLVWVKEQLDSSGKFGWTGIGRLTQIPSNADYPAGWIYPVSFRELDDVDPQQLTRTLSYCVMVMVAIGDEDELVTIDRLDSISNEVSNLLSTGPPGSIIGWSKVETGKYDVVPIGTRDKPSFGTQTAALYLYGSIAYLIPARDSRNTAP